MDAALAALIAFSHRAVVRLGIIGWIDGRVSVRGVSDKSVVDFLTLGHQLNDLPIGFNAMNVDTIQQASDSGNKRRL